MSQCTDRKLTIGRLSRRIYLSLWHRLARVWFVPGLAILVMWQGQPGFLTAVQLVALQFLIAWLPELVDKLGGRRVLLAEMNDSCLRLHLERVYEVELSSVRRISATPGAWPHSRAAVSIEGTAGTTKIATAINHFPLIRFVRHLPGRPKGASDRTSTTS